MGLDAVCGISLIPDRTPLRALSIKKTWAGEYVDRRLGPRVTPGWKLMMSMYEVAFWMGASKVSLRRVLGCWKGGGDEGEWAVT